MVALLLLLQYFMSDLVHMAKSFSGPDDGSQAIMIIEAQRQHFSQP